MADQKLPSAAPVVDNQALGDLFDLLEQDSQGQWCFKSLSRDAHKFQSAIERLAIALLPREQVAQWCDNCGSKQIVTARRHAAAATAAPVEQSDQEPHIPTSLTGINCAYSRHGYCNKQDCDCNCHTSTKKHADVTDDETDRR